MKANLLSFHKLFPVPILLIFGTIYLYKAQVCIEVIVICSNVCMGMILLQSALNLDHLAVPSSQLLSELIHQVEMELKGQYNCCIWRTHVHDQ